MGSAVFMEKHFGDGARPKGTGPKYSRSRYPSPPPTLTPPPEVEPGAHLIRFKVKTAGDYMLHVRYGQIELSGSPYPLHVFPSLLCVERCRVVGLNDKTGEVKAGEEVSGALLLADKCGNPVVPGPHVLGIFTVGHTFTLAFALTLLAALSSTAVMLSTCWCVP